MLQTDAATYFQLRRLVIGDSGKTTLAAFAMVLGIKGAFCGWNLGLEHEWINMAVATCIAALLHFCMVYTICELCCALPFASGPIAFSHACICNPFLGAIANLNYAVSYIFASATLVYYIQDILLSMSDTISLKKSQIDSKISESPKKSSILIIAQITLSIVCVSVVTLVQLRPKLLLRSLLLPATAATVVLIMYLGTTFYCVVTSTSKSINQDSFDINKVLNHNSRSFVCRGIDRDHHDGSGKLDSFLDVTLIRDLGGRESKISLKQLIKCFPHAFWFFYGIEKFYILAEEVARIHEIAPSSVTYSSLVVFGLSVPLLASTPMAIDGFWKTLHPIQWTLRYVPKVQKTLHYLLILPILLFSLSLTILVSSRHIYTLSRGALLPPNISKTTPHHGSPMFAVGITSFLICFISIITFIVSPFGSNAPTALIQASVALASISHVLVCILYFLFSWRLESLARNFWSPLRVPGACVGLILSIGGVLGSIYLNPFLITPLLILPTLIASIYWLYSARFGINKIQERLFLRNQINFLFGRNHRKKKQIFKLRPVVIKAKISKNLRANDEIVSYPHEIFSRNEQLQKNLIRCKSLPLMDSSVGNKLTENLPISLAAE